VTRLAQWTQQSLRARILALFLGLLLVVQVAGFSAIRASLSNHAQSTLPGRLELGDRVLTSLLAQRAQKLSDGTRLLAADYGFREAVSSDDSETIVSALRNHGQRIGATEAALLGTDMRLRASTADHAADLAPIATRLSGKAGQSTSPGTTADVAAVAIALLDGRPTQFVMVPVKAPVTVGWVLMGFPVGAQLIADLHALSDVQVTLLSRKTSTDPWQVSLSALSSEQAANLAGNAWSDPTPATGMAVVELADEELGVRRRWLAGGGGSDGGTEASVIALTSLSVDEATRIPQDLQLALLLITLVSCAVFAAGSALTAHRVTTPLHRLAAAADRLGAGDFATPMVAEARSDEIGQLSQAFERMRVNVAAQKEEILRLAYWDTLTGLPNRAQFRDAVGQAIEAAGESRTPVSVLMLDLDRFKHVNEVLGYRFGDLLLTRVAERLAQQLVRGGDVVARLGATSLPCCCARPTRRLPNRWLSASRTPSSRRSSSRSTPST